MCSIKRVELHYLLPCLSFAQQCFGPSPPCASRDPRVQAAYEAALDEVSEAAMPLWLRTARETMAHPPPAEALQFLEQQQQQQHDERVRGAATRAVGDSHVSHLLQPDDNCINRAFRRHPGGLLAGGAGAGGAGAAAEATPARSTDETRTPTEATTGATGSGSDD